jgi:hypothetical protein
MVERSQISKVMKEQSLDATGLTTAEINRIGQLTNTDYIIVGSISQYHYGRKALIVAQTKLSFQGRIVDVKTGDIAGTFSYDVETGKYAWCGCCICGWYYVPVLLFTDENITNDVRLAATRISNSIISQIEQDADRDCRRQ